MAEISASWTIVKFRIENSVEAVPTNWIIGNDECYWPPFTKEKLVASIRKSEFPNSCWPSFKVDIFRNATYGEIYMHFNDNNLLCHISKCFLQ